MFRRHAIVAVTRPRHAEVPRSTKAARRLRRLEGAAVDTDRSATADPEVSRLEVLRALATSVQ